GFATLVSVAGGGHHPPGQLDGDHEREVDAFACAILLIFIKPCPKRPQPRWAIRRLLNADDSFDAPGDRASIAAQRVELDAFFEQRRQRSPTTSLLLPMALFLFCKRLIDGAYATVKIVGPDSLRNPGQHLANKCVVVAAPLAPGDDVEGDFHRPFELSDRLFEGKRLVGLHPSRQCDDRSLMQTGSLRGLHHPSRHAGHERLRVYTLDIV